MTEPGSEHRPTVDDVDPSALAVNSVDDNLRLHADPTETGIVDSAGETLRVDEESDGDAVLRPDDRGDAPTANAEQGGQS